MGLSIAYHLAQRGVTDVVVLEREDMVGTGSTGRCAGGFRHQFSTEANIELSLLSVGKLVAFQEEMDQELDFHQDGYLFLLNNQKDVDVFTRNVELQKKFGIPVELIGPDDVARVLPDTELKLDDILAATYCGEDGVSDPAGVTEGLPQERRPSGRGDRHRRGSRRHRQGTRPRDGREDEERPGGDVDGGQRCRSICRRNRKDGGCRSARGSAATLHLDDQAVRENSATLDARHRLRDGFLLPPREWRRPFWHGQPRRGSDVRLERRLGFFRNRDGDRHRPVSADRRHRDSPGRGRAATRLHPTPTRFWVG